MGHLIRDVMRSLGLRSACAAACIVAVGWIVLSTRASASCVGGRGGSLVALLTEHERDPRSTSVALIARLNALGPAVVPEILDVLRDRGVPAETDSGTTALRRETLDALISSLANTGRGPVVRQLAARLEGDGAGAERSVVIEVLGALGMAADFELLMRAADPGPEVREIQAGLARSTEVALARIFERDAAAIAKSRGYLVTCRPPLDIALTRALAACDAPEAFDALADALGRNRSMDLAVLASLGESARRTRRELDARARDVVESHLRGRDALLARGAVLLTGQIESADSIGVLIDLLASEDRALREAAHWSLQRITRLQFGADGARWLAWHEQELLWSSTRSAAVFDLLGSDRLEHVTAGLQEISEHRLDRAALAGAVVPVLEHPEPAARRLACAVLGKLASDRAKSALEGHLTDADASVVQAAQAALGSIAAGDVSAHAASR